MNVASPVAPIVVRVPVVVLTLLVALGAALGLGAGRADAASDDQVWGFVDVPSAVDAGWQGPLTVSWRNFSDAAQTYRVELTGPGLDWAADVAVPAEETAFRREVAVPALTTAGTYRAELSLAGSDEVLSFVDVRVGSAATPHIVDVEASTRAIAPSGLAAQRRAVTTFGVDAPAGVTGTIVDASGATVLTRAFGSREAGERMRWTWSGQDAAGRVVAAGRYTMRLVASAAGARSTTKVALRVVR
ncbi:FlgD immunoglobulin-like domain containing protein [Nocardioides sp. CFH 31398]|uniref:FlgD immunoglobulin-like domain containing protein n=1 Tax=Nocardioides sp. CFH 31398 TaxID=2919579 RepID=UPI001F06DE5A|nr:FlgD immunoglobulin-like domain containing protein [Nocardioides sp. CFH 31398]MCH1868347.1 hypothetical protein [Nocardioides sp. CFH 31398]